MRGLVAWSLTMFVVMIVVAFDAMSSLYAAQQACFFQNAPCPQPGDPKEIQLAVAFVGLPLIWMAGLVIGIAGRTIAQQRRRPGR